jgi:hypothetical protein
MIRSIYLGDTADGMSLDSDCPAVAKSPSLFCSARVLGDGYTFTRAAGDKRRAK